MLSWRSATVDIAHLTWDDYLKSGVLTALDVARQITGSPKAHGLGFCIGGTLLSCAAAIARTRGEDPLASLTLLTTMLDFAETGEIGLLIDAPLVAAREATIGRGGLLLASELASVFSMLLRANDLVWPYVISNYLTALTRARSGLIPTQERRRRPDRGRAGRSGLGGNRLHGRSAGPHAERGRRDPQWLGPCPYREGRAGLLDAADDLAYHGLRRAGGFEPFADLGPKRIEKNERDQGGGEVLHGVILDEGGGQSVDVVRASVSHWKVFRRARARSSAGHRFWPRMRGRERP
jgi:hypothetical protein